MALGTRSEICQSQAQAKGCLGRALVSGVDAERLDVAPYEVGVVEDPDPAGRPAAQQQVVGVLEASGVGKMVEHRLDVVVPGGVEPGDCAHSVQQSLQSSQSRVGV